MNITNSPRPKEAATWCGNKAQHSFKSPNGSDNKVIRTPNVAFKIVSLVKEEVADEHAEKETIDEIEVFDEEK